MGASGARIESVISCFRAAGRDDLHWEQLHMKYWKTSVLATLCVVLFALAAFADTLTLKDGTVLEGRVIEQTNAYWVKTADGKTQMIPKDRVKSWDKNASSGSAAPVTPPPAASSAAKP